MYLPRNHTGKLPCIFVAPAGTRLYHGKKLSTEDRAEHLPYVRAGFAVVAYEIDGDMPGDKAINECTTSIKQFIKADGGIDNAKLAIDATLDSMPEIDRERLYTAGHSSAGTLALLVAENDPRIKACAAFAPCCDVRARIGKPTINALALLVPECKGFFDHYSPDAGVKNLHCPVFLFHAKDDHIISSFEVGYFADQLKKTNSRVTYVEVPQGDHYDAMIDAGISQAIEWLKTIRSAPASLQSGKKSN
jgi:dienelactone hydrolase